MGQDFLSSIDNTFKILGDTISILIKYPTLLVPMFISWIIYASLVIYFYYYFNWESVQSLSAGLWIFFLIGLIPPIARHVKLYFWIFFGASFAAYILVIIFTETSFVSTFGYYMLVVAAFIYAMCAEVADLKGLMRSLTLSTYSVFAVAVIAAVVVLTGEGDFSFDFSPDVSSNKRKKKP